MEHDLVTEITATATLGVGRAGHFTFAGDGALGAALEKLQLQDPARRLLDSAAIVLLSSRVGSASQRAEPQHQTPALEERLPSCSPAAALLIEQTISGNYSRLLPEALALLTKSKLRLPYSLLPDILDSGNVQKSLRPAVISVLGERGIWLAALNAKWSYVDTLPTHIGPESLDNNDWETATTDIRLSIVRSLRMKDPVQGINWLSEKWRKEPATFKLQCLKELLAGLSIADEPFLESALDDKSADVRRAAASLLARIPGSSFADHAMKYAHMYLSMTKRLFGGIDVVVTLPSAYAAEWSRYGIQEKSEIKDVGDRAWWFVQWVGFLSPEYWSKLLCMSPDELLRAIEKSEWADLLRLAWSRGAQASTDIFWKYALVRYWAIARDERISVVSMFPSINDLQNKAEELLMELLTDDNMPLSDTHPATKLLTQYEYPWSGTLARRVISSIKRRIAAPRVDNSRLYLTVALLQQSATKIPPALADELGNDWPIGSADWKFWEQATKAFSDVLSFRCQLHKEIQS